MFVEVREGHWVFYLSFPEMGHLSEAGASHFSARWAASEPINLPIVTTISPQLPHLGP